MTILWVLESSYFFWKIIMEMSKKLPLKLAQLKIKIAKIQIYQKLKPRIAQISTTE